MTSLGRCAHRLVFAVRNDGISPRAFYKTTLHGFTKVARDVSLIGGETAGVKFMPLTKIAGLARPRH